jgi:hypothetical protein
MKWEPVERKWWQVWRVFKGEYVEKGSTRKAPPLRDVVVFKGPDGMFSVSEDGKLWSVEQNTDELLKETHSFGQTMYRTIHPRSPADEHEGLFASKEKAMSAAEKWAGVNPPPFHPVPNRRAAIAHTKAKS